MHWIVSSCKISAPQRLIFDLRVFAIMFSHEPKDSGDENISGFGTRQAQTTSSGVLSRLNFSVRGPKHLPCLGKSQAERAPKFRSAIPKMDVLCMRFNWTHVTCQVTRTSSPIWGHLGNPRWMITWDFPKPDGKAKEKRFDVETIEIYYVVRQRVYLYPWCNRPKGQCGSRFSEYIFCWPRKGGGRLSP